MGVSIKSHSVRGVLRWILNDYHLGKRSRQYYDSEANAKKAAKQLREERERFGRVVLELSEEERIDLAAFYSKVKAAGLSLHDLGTTLQPGLVLAIPPETLETGVYRYQRGHFAALRDQARSDRGQKHPLDPAATEALLQLRRQHPELTLPVLTQELLCQRGPSNPDTSTPAPSSIASRRPAWIGAASKPAPLS